MKRCEIESVEVGSAALRTIVVDGRRVRRVTNSVRHFPSYEEAVVELYRYVRREIQEACRELDVERKRLAELGKQYAASAWGECWAAY